ncbi:MAG TPA: isoprenylcysteine carboxylmethyltransferase family protein [Acidiferrobacterales bacterium]|nr:isoprenylcysteine carboxylmethyltransferase family protein [Acidiferrobacterales bacterium]
MHRDGFGTRGGWWVVAQIPLLLLAFLIPGWTAQAITGSLASLQAYAGQALFVVGALLTFAGAVSLGRWLTPFPQPLPESQLRTGGAYALVRHPLYSGVLIMAFGWSLRSNSLAGLAFDVMLFVFFDRKAAREEIWLAEKFSGYAAYRRRVKKLIPWIY